MFYHREHKGHEENNSVYSRYFLRVTLRADMEADYLLADAWFGTKPMIRMCQDVIGCCTQNEEK